MVERKYFGTDGVRGKVGNYPVMPDFALKLGWAAGKVLTKHKLAGSRGKVLIGKDTRVSGYMLESALEAGLSATGVSSLMVGPMPTPAIAYLTRSLRLDAGIVISASHNPYYDNGVKFFSRNGTKLADEIELEIEALLEQPLDCVDSNQLGRVKRINDAAGRYIEFCKSTFSNELTLKGLKIVIDCANGATYNIAPSLFNELDAEVIAINIEPNGVNINLNCGATDVVGLRQRVIAEKADVGIAFDGDGDRLIMVDHLGNIIDGDQVLYVITKHMLAENSFVGGVVGTLASNMGLELAMQNLGIPFARSKIGDRYVLEIMQEKGWILGGENSGHIILADKNTTGDGIIAALAVLSAMQKSAKTLAELLKELQLFPQKLINIRYIDKDPLQVNEVQIKIQQVEQMLLNKGRLVIRKSGTEPLIRVMVEHQEAKEADDLATLLAKEVSKYK